MFGIMEALLSFLRRQIGLRTDAADPAGSLHGKVGDLKNTVQNNLFPVHQKAVTLTTGGVSSVPTDTTATIVSISGNRVVLGGHIASNTSPASGIFTVKLKLDGNYIFSVDMYSLSKLTRASAPHSFATIYDYSNTRTDQWVLPLPCGLHFSSSFAIEISHGSTGADTVDIGATVWHVPA